MTSDPAKVLAILFAIDPKVIARELKEAEGNLATVTNAVGALHSIALKDRTPEIEAQLCHLSMVQTHELCRLPNVLPEIRAFYARFAAGQIVQHAESAAMTKDELGVLTRQLAAIQQRAELAGREILLIHDAPPEYQALEAEAGRIGGKIADAVFVHILRRYALGEQADLFETNPQEFAILREIGGRIMIPATKEDGDVQGLLDAHLRETYGPEVVRRIHARVAALKAIFNR